jgi:hypothetical protein
MNLDAPAPPEDDSNMQKPIFFALLALSAAPLALASEGTGDDYAAKPLTAAEKAEARKLVDTTLEVLARPVTGACAGESCSKQAPCETCAQGAERWQISVELGNFLVNHPAAWDVATPAFRERFGAQDATQDFRASLLELLARTYGGGSTKCAEELYRADGKAFGELMVVRFAERGSPIFADAVPGVVKGARTLVPLAWLAQQGDQKAHRALLAEVKGAEPATCDAGRVLLAALVLERLGDEEASGHAWTQVQRGVHAALDAGDLERARTLALQADFMANVARKKAKGIAWVPTELAYHVKTHAGDLATAEAIFASIEEAVPTAM